MNRRDILKGSMAGLLGLTVTAEAFARGRNRCRCGVEHPVAAPAKLFRSKWGKQNLTYYMNGRDINDMEAETWDKEFRLAFDSWSDVTPLVFEKIDSREKSDLVIDVSDKEENWFGHKGDVLAWAQMPTERAYDGQLLTMFDLAEDWILPEENWLPKGIILRTVACHEIGHLLGLYHSDDEDALMYPYINDALKPRADDIKKIQKLYGKTMK